MKDTTTGVVESDGQVTVQVANNRIARLIQLGVAEERRVKARGARRRLFKVGRRKNRPYAGKRRSS